MEGINSRLERIEAARETKPLEAGRLSLKQRILAFREYHETGTLPEALMNEGKISKEKILERTAAYKAMRNEE